MSEPVSIRMALTRAIAALNGDPAADVLQGILDKRIEHNNRRDELLGNVRAASEMVPEGVYFLDGRVYRVMKVGGRTHIHNGGLTLRRELEVYTRLAANVPAAMMNYGRHMGRCGPCMRPLADGRERDSGMHTNCRIKMGWEDEARAG